MSRVYWMFPRHKFFGHHLSGFSTPFIDRTLSSCTSKVRPWNYHPTMEIAWKSLSTQSSQRESFLNIKNNIFKSPLPDIEGYSGILLHEFIWKNVDDWWNKTALECAVTGTSYTYGQLRRLSGRLATSLRKNNIRPGETVAVILPNIPEFVILVMAASEAGAQTTLINPNYTADEIKRQLENSEAIAVVTVAAKYPRVAQSIQGNSAIRLPVIVVEDGSLQPDGTINIKDLLSDNIVEFEKTGKKTERDPGVDAVILPYSSGTTGLPKGVELTHTNIIVNIMQFQGDISKDHQEQDILPVFLPFFHVYALNVVIMCYLSRGCKLICMPEFSSNALLEVFEKHKVSILYTPPPVIQMLANDARFNKCHVKNMKTIMCAAAPVGDEVISKFLDRAGHHFKFIQGFGLTETSPVITTSIYCLNAPVNSSGIVVPNTEVRIVGSADDNLGKNMGCNEVGEIYVRGPQVMKGYYKNSKATEECMEGDWFKTGDLGSFDNEGYLYISGRLKELIKVQGFQVAPLELENLLQGHNSIADAAVIGVPHDRFGEVPKAFVVLKPGEKMDEDKIKKYISERVSKHKKLGHVVFVDQIPKSAAGKILKKELAKM